MVIMSAASRCIGVVCGICIVQCVYSFLLSNKVIINYHSPHICVSVVLLSEMRRLACALPLEIITRQRSWKRITPSVHVLHQP